VFEYIKDNKKNHPVYTFPAGYLSIVYVTNIEQTITGKKDRLSWDSLFL